MERLRHLHCYHKQLVSSQAGGYPPRERLRAHKGVIIKTVGDAFLVDFPSVINAVQCAQQVHVQLRAHNAEKESTEQIHVRIGIHLNRTTRHSSTPMATREITG
jgi:Adenylate and Guanylate cyclase catalytic domain